MTTQAANTKKTTETVETHQGIQFEGGGDDQKMIPPHAGSSMSQQQVFGKIVIPETTGEPAHDLLATKHAQNLKVIA